MLKPTRLACVIALPLLICGCQSYSTPPITASGDTVSAAAPTGGVVHGATRSQQSARMLNELSASPMTALGLIALAACQAYAKVPIPK